jgi:hypothetical protein
VPDDLRAVAAVLTGQQLCRDCVVLKTDLLRWQVDDAIQRLGTMIVTSSRMEPCGNCRKQALVYRLT